MLHRGLEKCNGVHRVNKGYMGILRDGDSREMKGYCCFIQINLYNKLHLMCFYNVLPHPNQRLSIFSIILFRYDKYEF